jgi:hypothetical protein
MAKGQKRSSREPRKPKQDKSKPASAGPLFAAIQEKSAASVSERRGSGAERRKK